MSLLFSDRHANDAFDALGRNPDRHPTNAGGALATWLRLGYHQGMSTVELRRSIKKVVDQLPPKRLASLADYVHFLAQPELVHRLAAAEKAIASGKGANWRRVRSDV